jgi:hypothetical protein
MLNKKCFHLILMLLLSASAWAQPNKKVAPAMSKFLNTEFMMKYRDLRIEAESAAIGVQSGKESMRASDVFRLRTAYDQTATRANQILGGIKQDFLNAKKLKSIAEFPDMYSDGLRYKLQELSDFYAANFQQALADAAVDDEQVDGSAVLLLVVELIGLTKGLTNYFADIKREARQYTEAYLQENLVQPHRWRYWDELAGNASPYEKFEKSSELNLDQPTTEDPLDAQLQKVNQAISNFPKKEQTDGNSSSDFDIPQEGTMSSDSTTFQYEDWSPTEKPESEPVEDRHTSPKATKNPKVVKPTKPVLKENKPNPKSDQ